VVHPAKMEGKTERYRRPTGKLTDMLPSHRNNYH